MNDRSTLLERARSQRFFHTIGGQLISSRCVDVVDPATGEPFQHAPVASESELDLAVTAARAAQPGWAALSWDERQVRLQALADTIDAHIEWIATLHTHEQGMPFAQSLLSARTATHRIRTIAAFRVPDHVLIDDLDRRVVERWHPLGVVCAIAPWNAPLLLGLIKVANALISGNTIVLKPSELTPLSTMEVGRLSIGVLPDGVFNVVGGGREVGAAMVGHPGFDKVSFTGSTSVGISIAKTSAAYLRPVTLELGGNDAAILLPDGPIEALVKAAARTGFSNNGQFCAAVKRIYVPTLQVEKVAAALATAADAFQIGNGFDADVTLGPIQNKSQLDRVCDLVADARAAGGQIVTGGHRLDRSGYFFRPTVVVGLRDGARLVDEEQFGPVIPVVAYDDLDAVISQVNAGPYGLTASVWTQNLDEGERAAGRLIVGSAAVNRHAAFDPYVPFPLIKQSGMGIDYANNGVTGAMRLQAVTVMR